MEGTQDFVPDAPHRLTLAHPRGVSDILVGPGLLASTGGGALAEVAAWCSGRVVFLVTSEVPDRHCGAAARKLLEPAARVETIEVPDGEAAKTVDCAASVWQRMLDRGGKRDSRLVTLGGGAVGDLGGFAAACFLRGIDYVQIPTTLLAQVDASVGGKTGIDLTGGKNTVGAFHHPRFVLADIDCLKSLPAAELRAGLFEVVKMAALLDLDLLAMVEESLDRLLAVDAEVLTPVVAASVQAKLDVVEADLEEGDRRRLLNFGHTLGHAIESEFGYRGLRHGDAVGHGMRFALRLARRRGLDPDFAARLERLIDRLGPPALEDVERDLGVGLDAEQVDPGDGPGQEGARERSGVDSAGGAWAGRDRARPRSGAGAERTRGLPRCSARSGGRGFAVSAEIGGGVALQPSEDEERRSGGLWNRLRRGLGRTRKGLSGRIGAVLGNAQRIDEDVLEQLEETLIEADLGVETSLELVERLRSAVRSGSVARGDEVGLRQLLVDEVAVLLLDAPRAEWPPPPRITLMVGVNGSGKTTSAAKLAHASLARGERVLFAAADTFRAAAAEQLQVWGERLGVDVVRRPSGGDPAALVFDAVEAARARGAGHLIVDTAGRLHTRGQLMDELAKVHRVARRASTEAEGPAWGVSNLLVVDAGTGHNALVQAREFGAVAPLDAVFLAKIDGTAKGGMAVAIARDLRLPVAWLGVGEAVEDMVTFDPRSFASALFE